MNLSVGQEITKSRAGKSSDDLQLKAETLFLECKALQQEVRRLQALHPVICIQPPPPSKFESLLLRIVPGRRRRRQLDMIRNCGLFDAQWYLMRYPDVQQTGVDPVLHFLQSGACERRDPGPHFSTTHYIQTYPDIAEGQINPLLHYLQAGWREGRAIRPGMRHGDGRKTTDG